MIPESVIQERVDSRKAIVYTASEFKRLVRSGSRPQVGEIDAVTCATLGVMSGTMVILSIPVGRPGDFTRADTISLNGVPGTVGPCPNESLGIVDCILYGTSRRDASYGGGHLFRDMVAGRSIDVLVTSRGSEYRSSVTLSEIPFARMVLTRGAFRNYTCFVNESDESYRTIFSGPRPLIGGLHEASVSGCGEINPLQNDPNMDYLNPGATVLLNGAPGMVIGTGTRSTADRPNLSVVADMHLMRAEYMGGFITSEGPECLTSVAAAIPVTSEISLGGLSVLDEDIMLPLADVSDRIPVHSSDYSCIWQGTDVTVSEDHSRCLNCVECTADSQCPTFAHPREGIDRSLCTSCGLCVSTCIGDVFFARLGSVRYGDREVPIGIRQSSRDVANKICEDLKRDLENGKWKLRC